MEDNMDNLTLQYLLNNKSYQKIMSQKEDTVYNKQTKMKENESKIITIVENIINNDAEECSNEMIDTFNVFVKSIYKHWEMLEIQEKNDFNKLEEERNENPYNQDDEVDTIFENMQESLWGSEKVTKIT
uniref:Uncharacterized protein n=1 Tax=viral metagenome TaxID=1070528 RepID=A0A6C0C3D9_9ZZZZ